VVRRLPRVSKRVLEEIKEHLSFLTESGFEIVEEQYSPSMFGNALVIFISTDFSLRVIRDKGQFFADVSSPHGEVGWHDLHRVLEFLNLPESNVNGSVYELDQLANTIKANYTELRDLFSRDNYSTIKIELEHFKKRKALDMFTKH
jgi:hypothetical protein